MTYGLSKNPTIDVLNSLPPATPSAPIDVLPPAEGTKATCFEVRPVLDTDGVPVVGEDGEVVTEVVTFPQPTQEAQSGSGKSMTTFKQQDEHAFRHILIL